MSISSEEILIILMYCKIDDIIKAMGLSERRKGVSPKLSDSEVITMEIVGEFLGLHEDKAIHNYFLKHWSGLFPNIPHRTTFLRQAANLWRVKQRIQGILSEELGSYEDDIHIIDGFPLPLCHFRRASRSRLFKGVADYGCCVSKNQIYYGLQGVICISFDGIISGITVTPAHVDERQALWDVTENIRGLLIADKGFICPVLKQELTRQGIELQTPLKRNMKDERHPLFVRQLLCKRRLVETVIGQLTERFQIQKTKARDLWHLTNRIARKILSHTICIFLNKILANPPLQFSLLLQP